MKTGTKIITIILAIITLGLSTYIIYDKFIAKEECKPCPKEKTKTEEKPKETETTIPNVETMNTTQSFVSSDEKIILILNKTLQKVQTFTLIIDQTQSYDIMSGTYEISNNQLNLAIQVGCYDYNHNFNCYLPSNVEITKADGINHIIIPYDQTKLNFGNIELIHQ